MKIAVITGASGGLGREILMGAPKYFPEIEEYWLIARSADRLSQSAAASGVRCRIFPLDLTASESFSILSLALKEARADIGLLVNNSGCGYLGYVGDGEIQQQWMMCDLNVRATTGVVHIALPYMGRGARMINISSIASFCPNPRMAAYSATKAYIAFFSRALREELRDRGISVCAVCPGPMNTEFIYRGGIKGNSKMFDRLPYCDPSAVAHGALAASRQGRAVHTPRVFYKFYRVLAKLVPQAIMVRFTAT